jgi:hypothetical protein
MQRHCDGPVYSQSALGRCRGRKGKLVTTAAISSPLSVRVPQRSLKNRNAGVDEVYSLVVSEAKYHPTQKSPTGPEASRSEK